MSSDGASMEIFLAENSTFIVLMQQQIIEQTQ